MLYVIPVWLVTGISILLYGLLPRAAVAASWVVLALCLAVDLLTETGQLDSSLRLSPYKLTPQVLVGENVSAVAIISLLVVGGVFTVAGVAGFRRRDIG
jgi:ABC-2 type transport system permease protein